MAKGLSRWHLKMTLFTRHRPIKSVLFLSFFFSIYWPKAYQVGIRKKRLCSHGILLFLLDMGLSSFKLDNWTKDSVHTTYSFFRYVYWPKVYHVGIGKMVLCSHYFFLLSVYWPKAYQVGMREKRLCSHGVLLFLPDIDLSSVKVDNRKKDSVHTTLSFFLSFFLSLSLMAKDSSGGHWEKTPFTWETAIRCLRWTTGK